MADWRRSPGTSDEGDMDYDRESTTGIPRWVKVAGIVVAVVVLLVVAMMLIAGGGGHTPPGHGGDGGDAPPATVPSGHVPPSGAHG